MILCCCEFEIIAFVVFVIALKHIRIKEVINIIVEVLGQEIIGYSCSDG